MEFSESFICNKNLCSFSPNGKLIASVNQLELLVRSADTLIIRQTYKCAEKVDYVDWSPDSLYVLCASFSASFVHVFSIENPSWKCKITEGAAGLIRVCWSPDSRHILTTGSFHIQLSIWSLVNASVSYVHYLKEGKPGMAFSSDGIYLALLERRGVKDYILILPCSTWTPFLRLECIGLINVNGLAWYPDNTGICVWETPPEECLKVLWLEGGSQEGLPSSKTPKTLGVRCVEWSPTGQFLAFGANDGKVHILNTITWQSIAKFYHEEVVSGKECCVYHESLTSTPTIERPKYELLEKRPVRVAAVKGSTTKITSPFGTLLTPQGIRRLSFCPSGAWIASQDDSCPFVLWIWSISRLTLKAVLVHSKPISDAAWSPTGDGTLAFCTSNSNVSFWTPKGGAIIVPTKIPGKVVKVKWHPSGDSLLFLGRGDAILCLTRGLEKCAMSKR